jgi:hypothetical protein
MSATPVTLDFARAQPINPAQGVTLDFSKAVPLSAKPLQQPVQIESSAMDKMLGALAPQAVPRTAGAGTTQGDLPGFEGSYASGDEDKGAFITGAGVVTGAALATPAVVTALRTAAAAHPLAAKVIVKGLEGLGFGAGIKVGAKFMKLGDLFNTTGQ